MSKTTSFALAGLAWAASVTAHEGDKGYTLNDPNAIGLDPVGNLYIADTGNNRILKLNQEGELLASVGGFGWENEQFDQPLDVDASNGLDVFVADFNNERIERYDRDLNYLSSFKSPENTPPELRFGFPVSVGISRHGELFICDSENNRVLKLGPEGEPSSTFGDYNWGDGKLEKPVRIRIDARDQVYVADVDARCVVVFDYHGNYLYRIGREWLREPRGITWLGKTLVITDTGLHQLIVCGEDARPQSRLGNEGTGLGAFKRPVDAVIDGNKLFVLDSGNARVQVFELVPR
jgi:DNA-binding beta-propeller fold protein YncE